MSESHETSQSARLPPIGFEGFGQEPIRPLKKKKRRKNQLKTVALASQSFPSDSTPGYSPQHGHYQQSPYIDNSPDPNPTGVGKYLGVGELRLRKNPGLSREERAKRFTISDLEGNQPDWLRNQSASQKQMARQDVKDLLRKLYLNPQKERIDYVILHKVPSDPDSADEKRKAKRRLRFEKLLEEEGFLIEHDVIGEFDCCKLHCSFQRLCKEAEGVKLQMPLKNMEIDEDEETNKFEAWIDKTFVTDTEVDFVSAPFEQLKLHLFENCENPDLFFRSALRGLLTDHVLKNLDMRKLSKTPQYYYHHDDDDDPDEDILSKQGLPYLLMRGVYTDAFVLHDESEDNFKESQKFAEEDQKEKEGTDKSILDIFGDPRHDMNTTWPSVCKFQPLWMIRNYFGEEIALYFAWAGLLISTIMIPMVIGICVFIYGLFCSISGSCGNNTETATTATAPTNNGTTSTIDVLVDSVNNILDVTKESFDNNGTPWYAISVCLWSTVFMELWKRKNAVLAYEWDVNDFEDVEPDRPEYFGTASRKDPITQEDIPFYPFKYKCMKYGVSLITFFFMLCVVFAVMTSIILYRVVLTVDYCDTQRMSAASCFIVTTICSSLINALVILILGKVYELLAVFLTNWENHRTASAYRNALIIKLFAFQFANCYSSLYYIAFFRDETIVHLDGGLFGMDDQYHDSCGGSCMPDLSFQVLVLIIIKPLPRIFKDVILPWVLKKVKALFKKKKSTVDPESEEDKEDNLKTKFLEAEMRKPPLTNFTLNEYTEKVIQYGFIVLFAAAMPLGPLIAILFNTLDRVLDSKRLLWMYRRPVANIAQDMGMWHNILEFLNIAAVITNAFLIAFVSDWGKTTFNTARDRLYAVLVFEHAVFVVKYLLAIVIPDVPHKIRIAMRKEKFTVAKILETGVFVKDFNRKTVTGTSENDLNTPRRRTPVGERKVDSANSDVTARNVTLDPEHQDVTDRGYIGDAENDSPRKAPPPPPIQVPDEQLVVPEPNPTPSPTRTVDLDYGPEGKTYLVDP